MKVTADTNVLVCLLTRDDEKQALIAENILSKAEKVCVPTSVFCELVWVLMRLYRYSKEEVAAAIRTMTEIENLIYEKNTVDAGLEQLECGGDFADGVNEYTGRRIFDGQFVTFDKKAVAVLKKRNIPAKLL